MKRMRKRMRKMTRTMNRLVAQHRCPTANSPAALVRGPAELANIHAVMPCAIPSGHRAAGCGLCRVPLLAL